MMRPLIAVLERELLKLVRQRGRLLSSLVRPLIWLFVIGLGFDALLKQSSATGYLSFLVPGVVGMTMLFGAMLAALATVYDKESGVMRMLVIAPLPHYWIVLAKLVAAALSACVQAMMLLIVLALLGYMPQEISFVFLITGLIATAFACASLGMLVASITRTLDNYAVMMNLVIFPVFFLSGALYPIQHLPGVMRLVATLNPFTYGVDLLKHAFGSSTVLGPDFSVGMDIVVLLGFTALATLLACVVFSREYAYEPIIRILTRKSDS